MAKYRIVENAPGIFHIEKKILGLWWEWQATAYTSSEADQKLNNILTGGRPIPGYPRVIRKVSR